MASLAKYTNATVKAYTTRRSAAVSGVMPVAPWACRTGVAGGEGWLRCRALCRRLPLPWSTPTASSSSSRAAAVAAVSGAALRRGGARRHELDRDVVRVVMRRRGGRRVGLGRRRSFRAGGRRVGSVVPVDLPITDPDDVLQRRQRRSDFGQLRGEVGVRARWTGRRVTGVLFADGGSLGERVDRCRTLDQHVPLEVRSETARRRRYRGRSRRRADRNAHDGGVDQHVLRQVVVAYADVRAYERGSALILHRFL